MVTDSRLSYRPADAARLLGISREQIFRLLERGELRGFKIGGARLIEAQELARFIRERVASEESE